MAKTRTKLNKTSLKKIKQFFCSNFDNNNLLQLYIEHITDEVKKLKDCNEKSIVDLYIKHGLILKDIIDDFSIDNYNATLDIIKYYVRRDLSSKYTNKYYNDNIDIYFNDVKREYIYFPQNESNTLDFDEKNKDIFIKNNLKLVVSIAKKYRNFGLPFEDLIQAGNIGLMIAFDRFDTSRNTLRAKILEQINNHKTETFDMDDINTILSSKITYDNMLSKVKNKIPENGFTSKLEFEKWVNKHIKTATFPSVAYRWIESSIRQELYKYKTTVRFPKTKIYDDIHNSSVGANYIISLDSINPYTEDNYNDNILESTSNDEFIVEDEKILKEERSEYFKDIICKLLVKIPIRDARIIKKYYGIGFPTELNAQEIAESEYMSATEVKKVINSTLAILAKNISDDEKENILELFS